MTSVGSDQTSASVSSLLPCTQYMVSVTPITWDNNTGASVHGSAATLSSDPGPPEQLSVAYTGNDFVDLQWTDTSSNGQCINGVATFCTVTNDTDTGACDMVTRDDKEMIREGRVTHLSACTRYKCWAAYPSTTGDWIQSDTCVTTTWSRGVHISGVTRVAWSVSGDTVLVTWGGCQNGHSCVTGYTVTVSGHDPVDLDSDTLHYVIEDTQPGAEYSVTITPVSEGYGQDVTGEPTTITINT